MALFIYAFPHISGFSFEKTNIYTFLFIVFGASVMLMLSSQTHIYKNISRLILIIPIIFLIVVLLQQMGINPFSIIIKVSEIPFYPRTSGASSEPSFFANMIFYFAVLYYGIINKNKYLFGLIFGYIFLSTLSLTLFIYLIFVLLVS